MPSPLFRNLDRLAGVTGTVMQRDQARKEQLLQQHLSRMHESALVRQRADAELDTRLKVQSVSDKNAMNRITMQTQSRERIEEKGIEAGKYKKSDRWSWINSLKIEERYKTALMGAVQTMDDVSNESSQSSYIVMPESWRKKRQMDLLKAQITWDVLNREVLIPRLYPKIQEELNAAQKKRAGLGNDPKGSVNDPETNDYGEFNDYKR